MSNLVLLIGIFTSSKDNALRWMLRDRTDDMSTLVQVMAWYRQATNHYLSQCWPSSMSQYGVTKPQWVKEKRKNVHAFAHGFRKKMLQRDWFCVTFVKSRGWHTVHASQGEGRAVLCWLYTWYNCEMSHIKLFCRWLTLNTHEPRKGGFTQNYYHCLSLPCHPCHYNDKITYNDEIAYPMMIFVRWSWYG